MYDANTAPNFILKLHDCMISSTARKYKNIRKCNDCRPYKNYLLSKETFYFAGESMFNIKLSSLVNVSHFDIYRQTYEKYGSYNYEQLLKSLSFIQSNVMYHSLISESVSDLNETDIKSLHELVIDCIFQYKENVEVMKLLLNNIILCGECLISGIAIRLKNELIRYLEKQRIVKYMIDDEKESTVCSSLMPTAVNVCVLSDDNQSIKMANYLSQKNAFAKYWILKCECKEFDHGSEKYETIETMDEQLLQLCTAKWSQIINDADMDITDEMQAQWIAQKKLNRT